MNLLGQYLPKADVLIEMEPEALAQPLLRLLRDLDDKRTDWSREELSFRPWELLSRGMLIQDSMLARHGTEDQLDGMRQALAEAWSWLENHGLIVPDAGLFGYYSVTRAGRDFLEADDPSMYLALEMLVPDLLHPDIANRPRQAFLRGDYESAVFNAFKAVEVRVRDLGGFEPEQRGQSLMRAAFKTDGGPLTDMSLVEAEREGMQHLYAGAIAAFKNPGSHRNTTFSSPVEVAELILFADLLLRLAEARSKQGTQ